MHLFGQNNKTYPPHLGSEIFAACRTRPQYVLRSYCEGGSSRLPGRDADIVKNSLGRRMRQMRVEVEKKTGTTPILQQESPGIWLFYELERAVR
jgi:hypothetical protein